MPVLRHLDLAALILALPVFLVADWPMLGYAAGAVAWLAQRALQHWTTAKADATDDPKKVAGIMTGSLIGRGWLAALIIFGAGMIENDAGLAAAVLVVVLFTVYFAVSMILRPFERAAHQQLS